MKHKTHSPSETQQLGRDLASRLRVGDLLLLEGEIGSGKTTFLQGVVEGLGVSERVISPSFMIVREYTTPRGVFRHIDLYRLPDPKVDVDRIGLPELLNDASTITAVEWADRLPSAPGRKSEGRVVTVVFQHGKTPSERVVNISFEE